MPARWTVQFYGHLAPAPKQSGTPVYLITEVLASMPATVWKGFLSFGLVSFPIRLFSAARPDHIHFNMLHRKDLARIKEVWYCSKEDKPVDRADIVKGYEISKGE